MGPALHEWASSGWVQRGNTTRYKANSTGERFPGKCETTRCVADAAQQGDRGFGFTNASNHVFHMGLSLNYCLNGM